MEDISECKSNIYRLLEDKFVVDLIVLSYNGIDVTKKFIELLKLNTDYDKLHFIMIDNASSDGTPKMLKKECDSCDNMSLVLNSKNLGVIKGRNLGYFISSQRKNKSEYMMFLDNDQYVQKGWLNNHMSFLNSGYDLVGVEAWQMNGRFVPVRSILDYRDHFTYVGCGGMLMKRTVPDSVGMFDPIFNPAYFEDPDLNFRCYANGYKIGWNYKAKVVHLPHQTLGKVNMQEKAKQFAQSLTRFRNKWKKFKLPIMRQKNID